MTRGMVGWAGGSVGPDFFVYTGAVPATHWAHDHTVFAELADQASWATIDALGRLPVERGGMTMFKERLKLKVTQSLLEAQSAITVAA